MAKGFAKIFDKFRAVPDEGEKEKMFFHDLLNQTHGVLLFLSHKLEKGTDLSLQEMTSLKSEILLIQNLILSFAGREKDLEKKQSKENIQAKELSFSVISDQIIHLVSSFLGEKALKSLFFSPSIIDKGARIFLPQLEFFRILTNLLKNLKEQDSSEFSISFDLYEISLLLIIRNQLGPSQSDRDYMSRIQKRVSDPINAGLGLHSICDLTESLNGSIDCSIENNVWITKVSMPVSYKDLKLV